jgi:hypothetical protein
VKVGPYELLPETAQALALNFVDAARTVAFGWPRLGLEPEEIARATLRLNARDVLWAGTGHFRFMWAADFGKTIRGAWPVLGEDYLGGLIDMMIDRSAAAGRVNTCFSGSRGFDMPWERADGLPWLIFSHATRLELSGRAPDEGRRRMLQGLLDSYESENFADGMIAPRVTGDWVDTVRRPSSTYNNLCALMMLKTAPTLGLKTRASALDFEKTLFERRWRGTYFADAHESEVPSVDGAVVALYLDLGPWPVREAAASWLVNSGALDPIPMLCAVGREERDVPLLTRLTSGYHLSRWLHLGMMALNGFRRIGRDVGARRDVVSALIARHGQMAEAVNADGTPYKNIFLSSERGLSMAAGQYLELI